MSNIQKIKVLQWMYEKKQVEHEFDIPTETTYWFKTGQRFSLKLVPILTKWHMENENKPEEIWKFHCVLVYGSMQNKIEAIDIQLSGIPDILRTGSGIYYDVVNIILNKNGEPRTKKEFNADFNNVLKNIKKEN